MRVSIINLNWEARDAIGQCILNQVRFFQRRGDLVQVYLEHEPQHLPRSAKVVAHVVSAGHLQEGSEAHFADSDLYVYHYPSRYSLLETIQSLGRGVVIFYYHNVTPPDLWGSTFSQDLLQDSVASAGAYANYADLTVTDSDYSAEQLVQQYGIGRDRVRVLPLAVALDRFGRGPKDTRLLRRYDLYGKRVILFVGRMAGNKRVDLLVEALAQVRVKVPTAVLLLVGDERSNPAIAESVARARQRAVELGVADAVVFTGAVGNLPPYYRLADVYASASLHEGFDVPLIEAMASGVPVVATRATSHPWVVGDTGLLVEPGSATDLADKLVQVLSDDALCGELVQRGLARSREFSLEQYEVNWAHVVNEASAWLPNRPYPRPRAIQASSLSGSQQTALSESDLTSSADVMLRGYTVRSGLPLVGPLVAWVRRNLTSHLREPYLDPTLERQVAFNRRVARALASLSQRGEADAPVESRLAAAEAQLELLSAQVAWLELRGLPEADAEQLAAIDRQIEELRHKLAGGKEASSQ